MKIAIIGSRSITLQNIEKYIPENATEIVSGGAKGVDTSAREFALSHNLKLTEFLPEKYGKSATLKRNLEIIKYSDIVFAFWDGKSKGTKYVIDKCKKLGVPCTIYILHQSDNNCNK